MLNKILIFTFLLFLSSNTFGQRCGGGVRTFTVYTPNGQAAENLQYEYFPLTPKGLSYNDEKSIRFIEDTLFPDRKNKIYANFYGPEIIGNAVAEKFLKNFKPEDFYDIQKETNFYFQRHKKTKLKGKIEEGTIKNYVSEMFLYNFLMKITSDNYPTVYIAGTHFGACSRNENLLLNKNYPKLIRD